MYIMVKILRRTMFMWTAPDGTRVPKTHVTWLDDDGVSRAHTFDGYLTPVEVEYQVEAL